MLGNASIELFSDREVSASAGDEDETGGEKPDGGGGSGGEAPDPAA